MRCIHVLTILSGINILHRLIKTLLAEAGPMMAIYFSDPGMTTSIKWASHILVKYWASLQDKTSLYREQIWNMHIYIIFLVSLKLRYPVLRLRLGQMM